MSLAEHMIATNSTLGTDEYKPLNELMQDIFDNSVSLVGSDLVVKNLLRNMSIGSDFELFNGEMLVNGTLTFDAVWGGSLTGNTHFWIQKNNDEPQELTETDNSVDMGSYRSAKANFNFKKGDKIRIFTTGSKRTFTEINLCGTPFVTPSYGLMK